MQETNDVIAQRPELRMTRVFDAPRRLVFEAWTRADYLSKWFTPSPLTTPSCEVDLRPGGVFRLVMRMPDGVEFPMDARFTEVVKDERIGFTAKIHGDLTAETTVTFEEHDGKTTVHVHQIYSTMADPVRGANAGWTRTLDQLAAHVRTRAQDLATALEREIVLSRVFDAPRDLVFHAFTDRSAVDLWFGPKGYSCHTHEHCVAVGGRWRFDLIAANGQKYDNRIVYLEIAKPERLVYDHGSDKDDDPGKFRVTITFDEQSNGKTVVTLRQVHPSKEQRAAGIAFGAVELGHQTLDRLGDHLRTAGTAS